MVKPRVRAASPQFRVPDVVATATFYRERLGFAVGDFFGDPPVFTLVQRDGVEIQIGTSEGAPARSNRDVAGTGYDVYLHVEGVDALAEELRTRGATILEGPVDRAYRQREVVVRDLNGLILCFGEDLSASGAG